MPTWTVKADRRRASLTPLVARLRSLQQSVRGLEVTIVDPESFDSAPDDGNFRDFAPVAHIAHDEIRGLEIVAEDLISEFGWGIDLEK